LLGFALVGLAIVGGLTVYVANLPKIEPARMRSTTAQARLSAPDASSGTRVVVLMPEYVQGQLTFKETLQSVALGESPEVFAINAFLKNTGIVPVSAKAVSVAVSDGMATVVFSKEFETTYGTEDEQTLVKGILTTLGQFHNIKKVAFKIGDHSLETLGSIDLSEPQDVIR